LAISEKEKHHILYIFKIEGKHPLSINRFLSGKDGPVYSGSSVTMGYVDKVEANENDIRDFLDFLRTKNYIRPASDIAPGYYSVTEKGKEFLSKETYDFNEDIIDLEKEISNTNLLKEIKSSFESGDLDNAVFKAYRYLEINLREKAKLSADDVGTGLVDKAFKPDHGILKVPTCITISEEQGVHFLFRGSIQLFKNPGSHRFVDYKDSKMALNVIRLVEVLLRLIDESIIRSI